MKTQNDQHEDIWDVINDIPVAMLCTKGRQGMHSRPMRVIQNAYTGTLYFFVPFNSEVILDIVAEEEVNATFVDHKKGDYLTLTGVAGISSNKALRTELWTPSIEQYFPKGKDGGDAVLLEIKMHQGERWANKGGLSGLVERVRAFAMSDRAQTEIHEKFKQ